MQGEEQRAIKYFQVVYNFHACEDDPIFLNILGHVTILID